MNLKPERWIQKSELNFKKVRSKFNCQPFNFDTLNENERIKIKFKNYESDKKVR